MNRKNKTRNSQKQFAKKNACRLKTSIGGSALIEGVMMKGPEKCAMSVRLPDGSVDLEYLNVNGLIKNHKWLNIPILRGCINFVEQLIFSSKCLYKSAEKSGLAEEEAAEEPGRFEKWVDKIFGEKLFAVIMGIGMVLGVALSLLLFMYLPMTIVGFLEKGTIALWGTSLGIWKNVIEGIIKIAIFVAYLALVSNMKDIKRTFEYHGAEHKTIACYEAGEELTPHNAKKHTRFHPRCGTSFMFIILILSIIVSSFISWDVTIIRFLLKLAVLPIVVGIGYELIKFAGKHDNLLTRFFSAPGLWMQRLTTKEPDEKQLEIAITAMLAVIPAEPIISEKTIITPESAIAETPVSEKA